MSRWLSIGGVFTILFLGLGVVVSGPPSAVDLTVAGWVQGWWRGTPGRVAQVVSDAFGPVVPAVFAIALAVGIVVCWRRGLRFQAGVSLRVLAVLAATRLVSVVFKPLFVRDRPRAYPEFSYPSGHVVSICGTGLAATLLCVWLAPRLTRWVVVCFSVATVLCAASRVVLGVHWLSDTVGAVLGVLGVGILTAWAVRLLPPQIVPSPTPSA
ncbi:phosphatase PAP2 family protein [Amycolatopsis thermophila]|uniref:Undecaprenyl-diphosphatase n=1 Tax=Amycolatopsis thermophila TaxID=206084 RepID=A0ABU0EX05_9PSEU|nr:phosphatase PAP2 family protein [Amycolatopsis thermophila]MDQ0379850.1 undecaprenyl-diphosphatase [Amycolatopsis thermophila]